MNAFTKTEWTYAAVPDLWLPARWVASTVGGYQIIFSSMTPTHATYTGGVAKRETLSLRAPSREELREKILERFPQAVFSNDNPDDLKASYAAKVKADREAKEAVAAEKQYGQTLVSNMRAITKTWSEAQCEEYRNHSFSELSDPSAHPDWYDFFKARPNFLSWPDNSYENRSRILRYCQERAWWPVPTPNELTIAIKALWDGSALHQQPGYKRSERFKRESVRDYVGRQSETPITEQNIQDAIKRLQTRFGLPLSVSVERLYAVGFGDLSEELFAALQNRYNPDAQGAANKSSGELKEDLSRMRREARGGRPLSRDAALSGW